MPAHDQLKLTKRSGFLSAIGHLAGCSEWD
jgi:hypothetical protein